MWLFMSYALAPGVVLTHVIAGGLATSLLYQGLGRRLVGLVAGLEEALAVLLWLYLPAGWAAICTLLVAVFLYERIVGPRVKVQHGAVFLSRGDLLAVLEATNPDVQFDVDRVANGKQTLRTKFQYIKYRPKQWRPDQNQDPIDLRDVHSLEPGCDRNVARVIRATGAEVKQCFHLKLSGGDVSATVITPSAQVRDQWLTALFRFIDDRSEDLHKAWLRQLFDDGLATQITEKVGLTLDGVVEVMKLARQDADRIYLANVFNTFTKGSKPGTDDSILHADIFDKFYDQVTAQPAIKQVYERMLSKSCKDGSLSFSEFYDFLQREQKEVTTNEEEANSWLTRSEPIIQQTNALSYIGFANFLLDEDQVIFNRDHRKVYQSMDEPLSHYFIATSHNTYLTKDQLKGKSSVEAYVNALSRGCKCVELDCWDGPNNEPIIYHGHTLTSKILFKDVIQTIKDNAFVVSDYPLIVSLENHCSIEKQKIMAEYLTSILGDMLYTKPITESECTLPSPESLRGCVLLKNKKINADSTDLVDDDVDDDYSDEEMTIADLDEIENDSKEESGDNEVVKNFRASIINSVESRKKKREKEKVPSLAQELSDLVVYFQAVHFTSFEHMKEHGASHQMSSFGEKKAMKFAKEESVAMLQYNRRQLSRIYPNGSRIDSSNYDPVPLWNVGCQLVALNYQTCNFPMQLNQALFQDNGACGYVLKPEFMRQETTLFDPRGPFEDMLCTFLIIRLISGHQLPYKSENSIKQERSLAVQVRVAGVEADCQKEKTKSVKNNGYNPVWNEVIGFKLNVPELALVQMTVRENTDTFVAQYTLPVRSLKQGYRRVALQNKASEPLPHASLFVHIELKSSSTSS